MTSRSVGWWIAAALAPVGIFGGPIAIANLFAGLIEWRGWIGYLVNFWDENISEPVHRIVGFLALHLNFPQPDEITINYGILGALFCSSMARASGLLKTGEETNDGRRGFGSIVTSALLGVFLFLAWPLLAFGFTAPIFRRLGINILSDDPVETMDTTDDTFAFLTLAPFLIFLGLFLANFGLSQHS